MEKRGIRLLFLLVAFLIAGRTFPSPGDAKSLTITPVRPYDLILEPNDGVSPLVAYLNRARKSILVEAYILSDHTILRALERAHAEGVSVRVLLEQHPFGITGLPERARDELQAAGIGVRWSSKRFALTHTKLIVLDDRLALVSTANFSRSAFTANREVIVVDRDYGDVRNLSNVVRADWDRVTPRIQSPHLVLSPVNARSTFATLILSARKTLDVYAEEITDLTMARDLARAARHASVRVLLPAAPPSSLDRILRSGHVVMRVSIHPYIHAKVILVDGRSAFVGSENMSAASLDHNREVGLLISGPWLDRIARAFSLDWSAAR